MFFTVGFLFGVRCLGCAHVAHLLTVGGLVVALLDVFRVKVFRVVLVLADVGWCQQFRLVEFDQALLEQG